MQAELTGLARAFARNEDVRAVILTGAGDEAFCTGIDWEESIARGLPGQRGQPRKMKSRTGPCRRRSMFNDPGVNINPKTNDLWKPIIAAVNGMACGGALYMLGESDIIIAAEHATFFDPHVTYGMVAGFESVHLLQKLPLGEVLRMMLLGAWERMSAERAHQMGLVSEVVPASELLERALLGGEGHRLGTGHGVQGTLRAIWMTHELSRREALSQVSTFVALGTLFDDIAAGQEIFEGNERPPRLAAPLRRRTGRRRRSRGLGVAEVAVDDLLAASDAGRTSHLPAHEDHAGVRHGQRPVHELLREHDGDARPAGLFEALEDRLGDDRGQAERHLVRDDELRRDGERPGQGEHLLLPAREAAGPLRPALAQHRETVDGPVDGRALVLPLLLRDGHAQVVHDGEAGEDAAALRDVGQAELADAMRRLPVISCPSKNTAPLVEGRDPRRRGPACSCPRRWRRARPGRSLAPR